ncbi:MAG: VCBS repeat-containing protein [Spirochaetales bacterium]|nr:VCBS repeat-containing protein [Spirochaetales bacterium]
MGVTLDKASTTIVENNTELLIAVIIPANATNQDLSWTSDNEAAATVDANGLTTGIAPGAANITVTTDDGDYTDSCYVNVISLRPTEPAQGIIFIDTDYNITEISGEVSIIPAIDESEITDYVLYWGSNPTTKITPPIAEIDKTEITLTHTFSNNTVIPNGATHFLVYTKNDHGEMDTGISLEIRDLPVFTIFPGVIYGSMSQIIDTVKIIDIDEDGDMDIIRSNSDGIGQDLDDYILYYDNDGSENFTFKSIDTTFYSISSQVVYDLDEDGDLDIIASSIDQSDIYWFKNNGVEVFSKNEIYTSSSNSYFNKIYLEDVDGDGDIDIMTTGHSTIEWFENNGSESFTRNRILYRQNIYGVHLVVIDLDEDGDMDVCTVYLYADRVIWLENDGSESFTEHEIGTLFDAEGITVNDYDDDGDLDIIAAGYSEVVIYKNDGSESFTGSTLSNNTRGNNIIQCVDINGDSLKDIIVGCDATRSVFLWQNKGGYFTPTQLPGSLEYSDIDIEDLDGDGVYDIVGVGHGKLHWWDFY